jgi:hypothetical protein
MDGANHKSVGKEGSSPTPLKGARPLPCPNSHNTGGADEDESDRK